MLSKPRKDSLRNDKMFCLVFQAGTRIQHGLLFSSPALYPLPKLNPVSYHGVLFVFFPKTSTDQDDVLRPSTKFIRNLCIDMTRVMFIELHRNVTPNLQSLCICFAAPIGTSHMPIEYSSLLSLSAFSSLHSFFHFAIIQNCFDGPLWARSSSEM